MPKITHGPYEGADAYHLHFSREDDDTVDVPGEGPMEALRISIGGNAKIGFYFKFRGDPERVLEMLEIVHEGARQQLLRGRYDDLRRQA